MSENILKSYIENGGEFETIGNLVKQGSLKSGDYKCSDDDFK